MSPRTYQPARLPDGSANPRYRSRARPRGHRGKKLTAFRLAQFCAWDGEGITRADGSHEYFLLCSSHGDVLATERPGGLLTADVLETICARARALDRRTIHVLFAGSYDVNCWLRELSLSQLRHLWAGHKVKLLRGEYTVQYRARRSFVIREAGTNTRVTLWDVWGFFQSSFVVALEKFSFAVPPHLREMKQARAAFATRDRDEITRYCQEECRLLVSLMERVQEYLNTAGLHISRWDGAGACASALLRREDTRAHQSPPPFPVLHAAQHAYAGGRVEMLRYGHAPDTPIFHYDINSAYPAALRECPSLRAGRWEFVQFARPHAKLSEIPPFSLVHVRWRFTGSECRGYPFFWRAPDGAIYYPSRGRGWYWLPEVSAALAALGSGKLSGELIIEGVWSWHESGATERPFAWIDPLYVQRQQWKRDGIGAEKMIKLALNSLYGKCAQHVGGRENEPPKFHQLEWAGYVTSRTRATIYEAMTACGADTIMVATDGIFSTAPMSCRVASTLGAWEFEQHAGATVVQSGVYWLDNEHERDGVLSRTETPLSRGFDKGSLDRSRIVRAWRKGERQYTASLTRFVTLGAVASGHEKKSEWRRWATRPRMLALSPSGTKRADLAERWDRRRGTHPGYGLVATVASMPAALLVGDGMSMRYPLPWLGDAPIIQSADVQRLKFAEWDALE